MSYVRNGVHAAQDEAGPDEDLWSTVRRTPCFADQTAQDFGGCRMTEPKTLAEKLDAAQTGDEFAGVITGLFSYLEKCRDEEEQA
jgi:hypothetical protein